MPRSSVSKSSQQRTSKRKTPREKKTKPVPAAGPSLLHPSSIDRICLLVRSFQIPKRLRGFRTIKTLDPDWDRPIRVNGQELGVGTEIVWGAGNLQVTIGPFGAKSGRNIRGWDVPIGCWIEFTPSTILRGHNACIVTESLFQKALVKVEERLQRQGLIVDLLDANLSRVELCRDVALPRDVYDYWRILREVHVPYGRANYDFPNGFWRGGKSIRISGYDKRRQMRDAWTRQLGLEELPPDMKAPGEDCLPGEYTLRLEWQLRNPETVERTLGFKTVAKLLHHFNSLSSIQDQLARQCFFPNAPFPINLPEELGDVSSLRKWAHLMNPTQGKEKEVKELLIAIGYETVIHELQWLTLNRVLGTHYKALQKSATLSKLRTSIQPLRWKYLFSPEGIPYSLLYSEVYTAFFALKQDYPEAKAQDCAKCSRSKIGFRPNASGNE
jgi:hypothetical protein